MPDLDQRLAALTVTPGPPPATWAACAAHLASRHALNQHFRNEIDAQTGLCVVPLPLLESGVRGLEELAVLADALLAGAAA